MEKFDEYLGTLKHDIENNSEVMNITFHHSKLKANDLRRELIFFDDINLRLNDVLCLYRNKVRLTSPKHIKIIVAKEYYNQKFSFICKHPSYREFDKMFIKYIFVSNYNTNSMQASYLHEIMHSQLFVYKNIEKEINEEVLPIFIELLYGYYHNTPQLLYRLRLIIKYLEEYKEIESSKTYISSTLKAIELFELYISNNTIGKEIIDDISKVFDYDITLEELLDKYEISLDNYRPSLKKLIKLNK